MAGTPDYFNRDVAFLKKGDTITVTITPALARRGWAGGEFVRWVDGDNGVPTVDIADGRYCGFFPWGSNEDADQFIVQNLGNVKYGYGVMQFGGNVCFTRTYERVGYLGRHSLGPATPLVYKPNQALYISENGRITTEDESDTGLYPAHTFPNGDPMTVRFVFFGVVCVPPSAKTRNYLGIQTNFGV